MDLTWNRSDLGAAQNQWWYNACCSADGQIIFAQFSHIYVSGVDYPYYLSTDYGATWTEMPGPVTLNAAGSVDTWTAMTADGSTIFVRKTNSTNYIHKTTDYGANWTDIDVSGGQTNIWDKFAINTTGTVIVAAGGSTSVDARISISVDSGTTFSTYIIDTTTRILDVDEIDCSETGATIICRGLAYLSGVGWGRTYVSTDSGANWTIVYPKGSVSNDSRCYAVAISGDGSTMTAIAKYTASEPYNRLYISTNNGTTWTSINPDANATPIYPIGINSDGTKIMVHTSSTFSVYSATLYLSTNSGAAWTAKDPEAHPNNDHVTWGYISIQGSTILVCGGEPGNNLYLSLDSAATWSEKKIVDNTMQHQFDSVSCSDDGQTIIVSNINDGIYYTTNGGTSWTAFEGYYGDSTGTYMGTGQAGSVVKCSRDGTLLLAGPRNGSLGYISRDSGATWNFIDFTAGGVDDSENTLPFYTVTMSIDGDTIFVTGDFSIQFGDSTWWAFAISQDRGVTWTGIPAPVVPSSYDNWTIACNFDASTIYALDGDQQKIWKSDDFGETWDDYRSFALDLDDVRGIDCSSTGTIILIWDNNGGSPGVYWSINTGTSWTYSYTGTLQCVYDPYPESVVVSEDGVYAMLMGGDSPYPTYITSDSGVTWAAIADGTVGDYSVPAIGQQDDGSTTFILVGEYIYIANYVVDPSASEGTYTAAVIHGDPVESNTNAIKAQTTIRTTWELPFVWQFIECPPDGVVEYRRIRAQTTTPFWTSEKSLTSSQPVELHLFATASTTWRYADSPIDVDYTGGGIVTFRGSVIDVSFEQTNRTGERGAVITVEPFANDMKTSGLTWRYDLNCGVALYSSACGILRTTVTAPGPYAVTGALTGITNNVTLTATEFGTKANGWFVGGDIVIGNYRRKIMSHIGTTIVMSWKIPDITIGSTFSAYAGCDRTLATCIVKFANLNNFRGAPLIPDINPTEKAII